MDPSILGALIGGVLATVGALLGGIVTGWYTLMANKQSLSHASDREERERGLAFRQEQLSQFYGPVLACMEELEECWQLLFDADKNVEEFLQSHRDQMPKQGALMDKQQAVLEYKQYLYSREVTVFSKIKEIFISHFGYAEPSTKENYRSVVRFIENRNIINVTERKLDITFTGEDVSGLRDRIASLFRNLIDINAQIRNQLETGDPKPITQPVTEVAAPLFVTPATKEAAQDIRPFISARQLNVSKLATTGNQSQKSVVATPQESKASDRRNWPGRYTLLGNKASLGLAESAAEQSAKDNSSTKNSESNE